MRKKNTTKNFHVLYHQVDQMGVVHHVQYAYFLEQSRIDWLLHQGVRYAALEKSGILLPVVDISIQYKRPLHFDDVFLVHTTLTAFERSFISFSYYIENELGVLIANATTRLVFVDANTRKAIKCPEKLYHAFT